MIVYISISLQRRVLLLLCGHLSHFHAFQSQLRLSSSLQAQARLLLSTQLGDPSCPAALCLHCLELWIYGYCY